MNKDTTKEEVIDDFPELKEAIDIIEKWCNKNEDNSVFFMACAPDKDDETLNHTTALVAGNRRRICTSLARGAINDKYIGAIIDITLKEIKRTEKRRKYKQNILNIKGNKDFKS